MIDLGKTLPPMPQELKIKENIVPGCQSILYLHAFLVNDKIFFSSDAEALISKGLAAILIQAYQGLSPEEVLTCPPTFLLELQIANSLSPTRSNGLAQIHLRMKQKALQFLTVQTLN
jgi:cysteine desulfuration protein SufE